MAKAHVLIVDRQLVADGIRKILQDEFEVLGMVNTAAAAAERALVLQPDIVTLEITLNGAMSAASKIRQLSPRTRLMIVTYETDRYALTTALRVGAVGFVLKQQSPAELCEALHAVMNGRRYIAPQMRNDMLMARTRGRGDTAGPSITGRQTEVLQLVARGKTMKEIGALLGISPKTAEFHKAALMDGLGIRTTAELTRFAVERGMV
jgi:DNA-binding NarL/FixJ family response regulator